MQPFSKAIVMAFFFAFGALVPLGNAVHAVDPDISTGLQIYYSFDNASDIGHDSSSSGYNGILGGTVPPVASTSAVKGSGAFFNRAQFSTITMPAAALLGNSYTKSVWINLAPDSTMSGIISHPTLTATAHNLSLSSPTVVTAANRNGGSSPYISQAVSLKTWTHLVVTYDETSKVLSLYKDGVLATSTQNALATPTTARAMVVGMYAANSGNRTFSGTMDELRIYTRALTADEVAYLYQFDKGTVVVPPTDTAPVASMVSIQGTLSAGEVLTGAYQYTDAGGDVEGTSTYRWLRADTATSTYTAIVGATGRTYTASTTDAGKYLEFEVTPVSATSATGAYTGTPVLSAPVRIGDIVVPPTGAPPIASVVTIQGTPVVGELLTGSYQYTDADGDVEGTSTYQWLRSSTETGTYVAIAGATNRTYLASTTDAGMYLVFEVVPVSATSATGAYVGSTTRSTPVHVAATVVTPPPSQDPDISTGLQLYYSFDNASDLAHDYSGNAYNGTLQGTVLPIASSTGIKGGSAYFTRAQFSRMEVPSTALLGNSYTKSAWMYVTTDGGSGAGIIAHPTKPLRSHALIETGAGTVTATNYNYTGYPYISQVYSGGKWTHVVATYDSTSKVLSLYKDGALATSTSNVDPATATDRTMLIGATATGGATRSFGGNLDEVRVYTRALSADEINYLYRFDKSTTPAPAHVTAAGITNGALLGFDAVSGATDYRVDYRLASSSTFVAYTDAVSTAPSIKVLGLQNGSSYVFRVRAVVDGLAGPYSATVIAVANTAVQQAPTASAVTISGSGIEAAPLTGGYQYLDVNDDAQGTSQYRWLIGDSASGPFTPITGATSITYSPVQADGGKYLVFEVTPVAGTGTLVGTAVVSAPIQAVAKIRYFHILSTGQSLSLGAGPAISVTQPYQNVMLTTARDANNNYIEVAPFIPLTAGSAERIDTPTANTLAGLALQATTTLKLIATSHGAGGFKYDLIKKGTAPYARGISQATVAKQETERLGGVYEPLAVILIHGESDASEGTANYDQLIEQMRMDYQTDLNALTGSTTRVLPLFFNQTSQILPQESALRQLKAQREDPNMHLVGPIYQFEFGGDHLHLINVGSRMLGELMGKVMYDVLVNKQQWAPLMPTSITRTGSTILVHYHVPVPPLALDTTLMAARANNGYLFWQTGGNTVSITSVSVISADTVQIQLSDVPTGTDQQLSYAIDPTKGRSGNGGPANPDAYGGNIRDSDSRTAPGAISSGTPLYNWGVAFKDPVIAQ